MAVPSEWRCAVDALPAGHTAKFRLHGAARAVEGFLVHHHHGYAAYVNRCPHVGTPLDLWPNEFLDEEGRTIVCATHGAVFEPATGRCLAGPCAGDALTRLAVRVEAGSVIVSAPPASDVPGPPGVTRGEAGSGR